MQSFPRLLIVVFALATTGTAQWQANQPNSAVDIGGRAGPATVGPIQARLVSGAHSIDVRGIPAAGWAFVINTRPAQPNVYTTPGGQILNVPFAGGAFFFGGVLSANGTGTLPFNLPAGVVACIQVGVFDASAPDGVWLSAVVDLVGVPADVYVDGDSTATPETGSMSRPFRSISSALQAGADGQTIHVDWSAGGYVENLSIAHRDLRLVGDNWNQPGQPRPVLRPASAPGSGYTVNVAENTDGVTLERLEIHPGTYDSSRYPAPKWGLCVNFWDRADRGTVTNCVFTGSNPAAEGGTWGVAAENLNDGLVIEHCSFVDLDHRNPNDPKLVGPVYLTAASNVVVQNCEFTRLAEATPVPYPRDLNLAIVYADRCTGLVLRNNLIHDLRLVAAPGWTPSIDVNILLPINGTDQVDVINNTIANIDVANAGLAQNCRGLDFRSVVTGTCINNIVSDATWMPMGQFPSVVGIEASRGATYSARYCCVDGSWQVRYRPAQFEDTSTSINASPGFVLPGSIYRLAPGSPCLNTGDPSILDPNGLRSSMGCYGGPRGGLPIGAY